ncbi:MAG: beta-lactamase class [Patescibacteria group bacterium]|nr:beta-lactamase class [Patescibacteria group bacterium]
MSLKEDITRSQDVQKLTLDGKFDPFEMGFAVVDLLPNSQRIFGYNMDHFMYPASVSKVFIGAEVIRRVQSGDFDLNQKVEVHSPNDVDVDIAIFRGDTRPLLRAGDSVTIDYLLNLMLSRSDNTASNVLIDLVGRDMINKSIIDWNGWKGSEVTRKYMSRELEDPTFRNAPVMKSCARHITEFFVRVASGNFSTLIMLQKYMGRYDYGDRGGLWLPGAYNYYSCKGGRHDSKLRDGRMAHWLHDAGIVVGKRSNYVVALMTLDKNDQPASSFPMREFAQALYEYMESYKY